MAKDRAKHAYRTRNYATMVYPDSAPENWLDIFAEQYVPAFVSPLHNLDKNPTGEPKKPHYHVIVMFDSVKTREQAEELFAKIGGVGCIPVQSVRGYTRYLCHLDNPEKTPYNPEEVRCFCGAEYYETIHLITDKRKLFKEIQMYCRNADVVSFSDLLDFACDNRNDWYDLLTSNTLLFRTYLKSRQWTNSQR